MNSSFDNVDRNAIKIRIFFLLKRQIITIAKVQFVLHPLYKHKSTELSK